MCRLVIVTCAIFAILIGISGLYMMPKLIQRKIEERIQLKIGTKTFDRFTRIPIPLTVKFYFFSITNSEQVLRGLERPKFQEVGPFMFKQWRRREIVDIVDNNRKITYREIKTYHPMFPPELVNSSSFVYYNQETQKFSTSFWHEDEQARLNEMTTDQKAQTMIKMLNPNMHNITLINLPLLSVLTELAKIEEDTLKRSVAIKIASRLIEKGHERILIKRRANQLLFDGYKVGLMDAADDLLTKTLGFNFDSPLPRNKFGFFYMKNGTWSRREAGEMTIFTGRNNSMGKFMMVDNWNGLKSLSVWPRTIESGNRCNEIRGTDGSQFFPGVTRQQVLQIFSPLICTSIYVKYKEDTSVRDIPLLRFATPSDVFAAPKKNPHNACYCTVPQEYEGHMAQPVAGSTRPNNYDIKQHQANAKITNARCYIDGIMDLSLCQRGAPIAASAPHFYNSDPMLSMVAGLRPRKEAHETYLDIEPMSGSVMRAASRAQLNAFVEQAALNVIDSEMVGNMTPMIAPMLWFEESAEIDEKSSIEFKNQLLNLVQRARRSFMYAIVFGFLVAIIVAAQYWYVICYRTKPRQVNLQDSLARRRARRRKALESGGGLSGARRANLAGRQPLIDIIDMGKASGKTLDRYDEEMLSRQTLVASEGSLISHTSDSNALSTDGSSTTVATAGPSIVAGSSGLGGAKHNSR